MYYVSSLIFLEFYGIIIYIRESYFFSLLSTHRDIEVGVDRFRSL